MHRSRAYGLRLLRFVGHGPADELAPPCAPEDRGAVAEAFRSAPPREPAGIPVSQNACLAGDGWAGAPGGTTLRRELSPELELSTSDWDEFVVRSSNSATGGNATERRLTRDHGLRCRLVSDPATIEADMDCLFRLHDACWATTTAFTRPSGPSHVEAAAAALKEGWLRMWFAELEGRPAAVWYGFRMGGADWFYQQGRDPAWERSSVGFVLTAQYAPGCRSIGHRPLPLPRGQRSTRRATRTATGHRCGQWKRQGRHRTGGLSRSEATAGAVEATAGRGAR